MEQNIIDSIIHEVNKLIKKEEYSNVKIEYLLVNKENHKNSIALISDNNQDLYEVLLEDNRINPALDWAYNIDDDVFANLESQYEIGFMNLEFHFAIWNQFNYLDVEEFNNKLGLQKYLKFCKDNNISKKVIYEQFDTDVVDIMKYFDEKMNYTEIENGLVKIPQDVYKMDNEIRNISFYLGYDLLNDKLSKLDTSEYNRIYNFCNYLANKFIKTDYYKKRHRFIYDNLSDWIRENEDIIKSEFLNYFGFDNKRIIKIDNRGKTKVALVEILMENTKKYAITLDYSINNESFNLGGTYYYGNDSEKAKEDFEKVKVGGKTFEEEKISNLETPKCMEKYKYIKENMDKKLKSDEGYNEYKIECVLIDKNKIENSYGIAMDYNEVAIVYMSENEIKDIPNAEYRFDLGSDVIFLNLEKGKKEISYMSLNAHSYIWQELEKYPIEDIKYNKGVQKYLKYCKDNNITRDIIVRETGNKEIADAIKYYKEKKIKNKKSEVR